MQADKIFKIEHPKGKQRLVCIGAELNNAKYVGSGATIISICDHETEDFLATVSLSDKTVNWEYSGNLSKTAQNQVVEFLTSYKNVS